ncbi:hypothetical protein HN709_02565 [Candidatus Peregrinibacteria bacterium]|jgi:hypothetical protein|nr:hypothetical protein [Candidatus Peregrinibacteria bacterium]MBT7736546.1 hypothetical protein [Candidatus Peregrinibacteria bacterium]
MDGEGGCGKFFFVLLIIVVIGFFARNFIAENLLGHVTEDRAVELVRECLPEVGISTIDFCFSSSESLAMGDLTECVGNKTGDLDGSNNVMVEGFAKLWNDECSDAYNDAIK